MRKIELETLQALKRRINFKKSNMAIEICGPISKIFLHGNHIADFWHYSESVNVNRATLAAWPTPTTLSRLRSLGVNVCKRKGVIFLDGLPL